MAKDKAEKVAPKASVPSLRDRLRQAISTQGQRPAMDPAILKPLAEKRAAEIIAILSACNAGRDNRPEDYLKQLRFEGQAIADGIWCPRIRPGKTKPTVTQELIPNPGTPLTAAEVATESAVDAVLEGM